MNLAPATPAEQEDSSRTKRDALRVFENCLQAAKDSWGKGWQHISPRERRNEVAIRICCTMASIESPRGIWCAELASAAAEYQGEETPEKFPDDIKPYAEPTAQSQTRMVAAKYVHRGEYIMHNGVPCKVVGRRELSNRKLRIVLAVEKTETPFFFSGSTMLERVI